MKNLLLILAFFITQNLFAVTLPHYFNFDGYLLDGSNNPLTGPQTLTLKIYNPALDCLLYEEAHTGITPDATDGSFSIKVGAGTRNTAADGNSAWEILFQNSVQVRSVGANCASGYTPSAGQARLLQVIVSGTLLSPEYVLSPVPYATTAETLQSKQPSDFVSSTLNSTLNAVLTIGSGNSINFANAGGYTTSVRNSAGSTSTLNFVLPTTAGTGGNFLSTDGSGNLSWATPAPPTLTLPNGQIYVGNGSNVATPQTVGGDGNLSSAGLLSVTGLQGNPVDSATPVADNVLAWNNISSRWEPTNITTLLGNYLLTSGGVLTGSLDIINGSAASPALRFTASTNTGIYSTGANTINISTNGAARVAINSIGDVGIGTTTPTSKLHVNGATTLGVAGTPITQVQNFPSQFCSLGTVNPGNSAYCDIALGVPSFTTPYSVQCVPDQNITTPFTSYCYLVTGGSVRIVVNNVGGVSIGPINSWHVTYTQF